MGVESSESLQQILGFINSNVEVLNLQGNSLQNKGCFNIMRALEINRTLKKVNLADNKFSDEDFLIDQIYRILESRELGRIKYIFSEFRITKSKWDYSGTGFKI